jgi:hypothetical protein
MRSVRAADPTNSPVAWSISSIALALKERAAR